MARPMTLRSSVCDVNAWSSVTPRTRPACCGPRLRGRLAAAEPPSGQTAGFRLLVVAATANILGGVGDGGAESPEGVVRNRAPPYSSRALDLRAPSFDLAQGSLAASGP